MIAPGYLPSALCLTPALIGRSARCERSFLTVVAFSVDSASNKRNADELEQQRHDAAPLGDESHLKKAKTDEHQAHGPSRVLHVRNLPLDVAESELAALCAPFGQVQNILPLKGKSQAFVQLDTPQAAAALLQYYSTTQATLRGKSIYFQYSSRDSITVQQQVETPKPILLVTITNLLYPVTIEVLYGVFSKYGTVAKIVIFSKTAGACPDRIHTPLLQFETRPYDRLLCRDDLQYS